MTESTTRKPFIYDITVLRVIDGDTIDADIHIDAGFDIRMTLKDERIRMIGIDTPETRTSNPRERVFGKMAKNRLAELLPIGSLAVLNSIRYDRRDAFGRVLGTVTLADGRLVNDILLEERLAVPWNRSRDVRLVEHRKNWDYWDAQTGDTATEPTG